MEHSAAKSQPCKTCFGKEIIIMKNRQAISKLRAASVLLAAALMLSGALSAGATVITVPDDYLTIQEAVNAAASGDTVYVR